MIGWRLLSLEEYSAAQWSKIKPVNATELLLFYAHVSQFVKHSLIPVRSNMMVFAATIAHAFCNCMFTRRVFGNVRRMINYALWSNKSFIMTVLDRTQCEAKGCTRVSRSAFFKIEICKYHHSHTFWQTLVIMCSSSVPCQSTVLHLNNIYFLNHR